MIKTLFVVGIFVILVCLMIKNLFLLRTFGTFSMLTHYGDEVRLGQLEAHFVFIVSQNTKKRKKRSKNNVLSIRHTKITKNPK